MPLSDFSDYYPPSRYPEASQVSTGLQELWRALHPTLSLTAPSLCNSLISPSQRATSTGHQAHLPHAECTFQAFNFIARLISLFPHLRLSAYSILVELFHSKNTYNIGKLELCRTISYFHMDRVFGLFRGSAMAGPFLVLSPELESHEGQSYIIVVREEPVYKRRGAFSTVTSSCE